MLDTSREQVTVAVLRKPVDEALEPVSLSPATLELLELVGKRDGELMGALLVGAREQPAKRFSHAHVTDPIDEAKVQGLLELVLDTIEFDTAELTFLFAFGVFTEVQGGFEYRDDLDAWIGEGWAVHADMVLVCGELLLLQLI